MAWMLTVPIAARGPTSALSDPAHVASCDIDRRTSIPPEARLNLKMLRSKNRVSTSTRRTSLSASATLMGVRGRGTTGRRNLDDDHLALFSPVLRSLDDDVEG